MKRVAYYYWPVGVVSLAISLLYILRPPFVRKAISYLSVAVPGFFAPVRPLQEGDANVTFDGTQEDDKDANFVDTLSSFTEIRGDLDHFRNFQEASTKWVEERRNIIKNLRHQADRLEKISSGVVIAEKVSAGVKKGAKVAMIGGMIAAPFTAGLSLGLTVVGSGASALGDLSSLGGDAAESICNKVCLKKIRKKLDKHQTSSSELTDLGLEMLEALDRLSKFEPILERMAELSEQSLQNLFELVENASNHVTSGNSDALDEIFDQVEPEITNIIDPESLKKFLNKIQAIDLAELLAPIKDNITLIKSGLDAFIVFRNHPKLTRLCSSSHKSPAITKYEETFKGTSKALSDEMDGVTDEPTALDMVADIQNIIRLCQDKNETPNAVSLREMADGLEKDIL